MAAITVVISLYNKEKDIGTAIRSVLAQTYTDWRLLIIDDASTDQSKERVQPFLTDSRIELVSLARNLGQTHLLNYALTRTATPYFVQLDADDWLTADALSFLMDCAGQYPQAALLYADHVVYWEEEGRLYENDRIVLEQYRNRYDLLVKLNHALVPRCYRTDCVRNIGGWMVQTEGDMLAEDVQMILRLASKYEWRWINRFLYCRTRDERNRQRFIQTQTVRNHYRRDLYNQILREWGDEYRAEWREIRGLYYLSGLVPSGRREERGSEWFIP